MKYTAIENKLFERIDNAQTLMEKLLRVIQEREKTFRDRLDCLGADDRMTRDAFSELLGLEESFEVIFGCTVVDYILMKDFENKEEKEMEAKKRG